MDAFFASVELASRPFLKGRPAAVRFYGRNPAWFDVPAATRYD